ncbi:MAG: site-specific DNA-methyltransferase [Rhodopirellula sp.]|nr:site-specific DNA-methyltransferase [Rhodopirellula sp.]
MTTLPDGSVTMIWTDPPYGHGNADGDLLSRRAAAVGDGYDSTAVAILNDLPDTMRECVDVMLREAVRVLSPDCCCCCCCCCCGGGPRPTFAWVANRMDSQGLQFFHSVIWDKKNPGMGWRYRRQHEMVMVAHRKGGRLAWANADKKQRNIISISKPRDCVHPNEKPVELVKVFTDLHTLPGQTILDPFMGSGTTGIACIRTGRRFIGIELDPAYFEIARKRIEAEWQAKSGTVGMFAAGGKA